MLKLLQTYCLQLKRDCRFTQTLSLAALQFYRLLSGIAEYKASKKREMEAVDLFSVNFSYC